MTLPVESLERLRALITERLGLVIADADVEQLSTALQQRLRASECPDAEEYLHRLADLPGTEKELYTLGAHLTVGETFFFRHQEHMQAFIELAVPESLQRRGDGALRILSAGCASGEEPYTLAMLLRQYAPTVHATIHAFDLNKSALTKAAGGRYSPWSLRAVSDEVRERWFRTDGRDFVLDASIRRMVHFEQQNLSGDAWAQGEAAGYDIIFCRNVLMYLHPAAVRAVVARCAALLPREGFFFLGHAETLRGVSHAFHLREYSGSFVYQRRAEDQLDREADAVATLTRSISNHGAKHLQAASMPDADSSWIEAIQQSSRRITALQTAEKSPRAVHAGSAVSPPTPLSAMTRNNCLTSVFELFCAERYTEALEYLQRESACAVSDPDVLLLHAVMLINGGKSEAAEQLCETLLAHDEFHPGAHYLLALCREQAGDIAGAMHLDRTAIYLDPNFAMARLHLGLLYRHAGERATARLELRGALERLEQEDAARLLIFGGGFSREALMQLCCAELRACGG